MPRPPRLNEVRPRWPEQYFIKWDKAVYCEQSQ